VSENTIISLRKKGENLHSSLQRELYSNLTGLKREPEIEKIFKSEREFCDPALFKSINETPASEEEKTGVMLMSQFLADFFINCGAAHLTDRILAFETTKELRIGKKRIPYRSAQTKTLNEHKKQKRDEIERHRTEVLEELNPYLGEKLYLTGGTSETLDFTSYAALKEHIEGDSIGALSEEAKLFIRDTEYIAKEMLEWFLMRRMGFPLEDAAYYDAAFMFNSFELGGAFKKDGYTRSAARMLDDSGLTNSADVKVESAKRAGKAPGGLFFPIAPPLEMAVSIFPAGGPADYESYLGALGSALSYAFTEGDDDFEYRCLRDRAQTEIYSELFTNLIYERSWLKRYLGIDEDMDFYKFLFLRRLMKAREDAGRLIYGQRLYGGGDVNSLPDTYKEIMEEALQCEVNERDFLNTREPLLSYSRFKARLIAPSLRNYLRENYDEEWWRLPEAGGYLRSIWSKGGRYTSRDIAESTGYDGSTALIKETFERELG
jgi:hypothetical protein